MFDLNLLVLPKSIAHKVDDLVKYPLGDWEIAFREGYNQEKLITSIEENLTKYENNFFMNEKIKDTLMDLLSYVLDFSKRDEFEYRMSSVGNLEKIEHLLKTEIDATTFREINNLLARSIMSPRKKVITEKVKSLGFAQLRQEEKELNSLEKTFMTEALNLLGDDFADLPAYTRKKLVVQSLNTENSIATLAEQLKDISLLLEEIVSTDNLEFFESLIKKLPLEVNESSKLDNEFMEFIYPLKERMNLMDLEMYLKAQLELFNNQKQGIQYISSFGQKIRIQTTLNFNEINEVLRNEA